MPDNFNTPTLPEPAPPALPPIVPPLPPVHLPNEQGVLSRGMDWLFGVHWTQKVKSACGYVQMLCGALAGGTLLSATQVGSLGVPWLAHHWLGIVGWATIINGASSLVSKRIGPPPNTPTA